MTLDLFTREPKAVFSDDGKYRYLLDWPTGLLNERIFAACGANPSVAGQRRPDGSMRSDPTFSRICGLGYALGYGRVWMVNVRSWISTDPAQVPPDPQAIGERTDGFIRLAASQAKLFLCCWGHLAGTRGPEVLKLVRGEGAVPHALKLNGDGTPAHPRGIPLSARPFRMEAA